MEKNDVLMNEFQSIGFYMSDHPLNAYRDYFEKMNVIVSTNLSKEKNTSLVAGTIMSIQEKKALKEHLCNS